MDDKYLRTESLNSQVIGMEPILVGQLTLLFGLVLFLVGIIAVYLGAGSLANTYGIVYGVTAILSALMFVLATVYLGISDVLTNSISGTSIPLYVFVFLGQLTVFLIPLWRWLRLLRRVKSTGTRIGPIETQITEIENNNEVIDKEITNWSIEVKNITKRIAGRYEGLEEIQLRPR